MEISHLVTNVNKKSDAEREKNEMEKLFINKKRF